MTTAAQSVTRLNISNDANAHTYTLTPPTKEMNWTRKTIWNKLKTKLFQMHRWWSSQLQLIVSLAAILSLAENLTYDDSKSQIKITNYEFVDAHAFLN